MLGLCCSVGFSLVVTSGGTVSLVAVHRLLIAMVLLWSTGSRACRLQ